ncbi:nuclear factor NF-kappa-B p100 subunit-like [Polyodon spathula]|uniref:nuclear factor NF-kappa-B p100 subunit-like n=1 Tax=Polyodon spathula TaxID=7913 RepID=UPI001B7E3B10|nr:nuclear factor NF-kappa-B p100 subunit-like [Polyodon spathula]
MERKQRIHIFLGAPIFSKEKGTTGTETPVEETLENWNRIELSCREGKLHPVSELREGGAIAGDAGICRSKRAAGYSACSSACNHSDRLSVNRTRPSSDPSRQNEPCSPLEMGKEAARQGTEGTGAQRSQTASGRKRLVSRSLALPSDAITEYLDSCFPEDADPRTAEQELSTQTEFLSVWATSQAAILKGLLASECGERLEVQEEETVSGLAPERHTPTRGWNSTPGAVLGATQPDRSSPEEPHTAEGSEELFSAPGELLPRGEGGVVMETCCAALLCSQEEPPHQDGDATEKRRETEEGASKPTTYSPPAPAPASKKTRTSPSNQKGRRGLRETRGFPGKPALLMSCVDQGQRYEVLACVLNPCHLKEVRVRSGMAAGSAVPLATIMVTDQSGTERKVVLWRAAAFWALTVYPGDLVLITDVTVKEDQWRGETVLQSTPASKLLNLGQFFNINHERVPGYVDRIALAELQGYLREKHSHLLSIPPRAPQSPHSIRHARLGVLRADTLVHALLRVTCISTLTVPVYSYRGQSLRKVVLSVEQGDGQQGALVLWGGATAWLPRIQRKRALVWDFRCLLVRWGSVSGFLELHSTPWSSCEPLFPDDSRALEFWSWSNLECCETDLQTLLSFRHSGEVVVKAHITALQFTGRTSHNAQLLMDGDTPLQRIVGLVADDITFVGCGRCGSELGVDDNRIYQLCYPCLPHTGVKRYYRPAVMTVTDKDSVISVEVPPVLVEQIFLNIPAEQLNKPTVPSSQLLFSQVVSEMCLSLLSHPADIFLLTLRCSFLLDENSIPLRQHFLLLDFHPELMDNLMIDGDQLTYEDLSSCHFLPPISSIHVKAEPYLETANGPYLAIIEEPKQRGFRFRYECEGPSHGGLPGASSEKNKKTYPTVKIYNHVGYARVEVQLVTHSDPPRVHAHSLVGKQCSEHGVCSVNVGPNDLTAQFNNLGILHVTKKGVNEVLTKRLKAERMRQRGDDVVITEQEEQEIANEARELGKVMDLNVVRLKFMAYLQDSNGGFTLALKPVISQPIYDSKSPNASNLKISRMDKTSGSATGGDEIFLLCDKVQKDDIEVRFYEDDDNGWEAYGDFAPTDVHKQYAIVFKTPPYRKNQIDRPVTVFLQLKRKKGGDASEPKQFTYHPQIQDKEEVQRKKLKPLLHYQDHYGRGGAGGPPGGFGAGGAGGGGSGFFPFPHSVNSSFSYNPMGGGYQGGTQMPGAAQRQDCPASSGAPQGGQSPQQQLVQIASLLQSKATLTARRTARALLDYASTGDARMLLAVQRQLCGVQDENGDTPLHLAIIHQQASVVEKLVQVIVSIPDQRILNQSNHLRQTPLHLAVITKQHKIVDFLLKAGADPTPLDRYGNSVLHLATPTGDEHMLRILLSHLKPHSRYLLNTPDYNGLYPLHLAVQRSGEQCLRVLVDAGAEVNAVERKSGCTALHLAVQQDLFAVACLLITELNADVNVCSFGGNTPLHLAASQGSPVLCSMLIAAGAERLVENDEPVCMSSASLSEEEREETQEEESRGRKGAEPAQTLTARPNILASNPRKRPPTRGHTPLDLAKNQKVQDILEGKPRRPGKTPAKLKTTPLAGTVCPLDSDTLARLSTALSAGGVQWKQLAEKLGMRTLADLYEECPSPCNSLLQGYQVAGGRVESLIDALQALGLNEGVRVLREAELKDKTHTTEVKVDSGYGSHPTEQLEQEEMDESVPANS